VNPFGPGAEHAVFVEAQGAYLLGALPEGEREAFEAHLSSCERCRDDVAGMHVVADALPAAVPQVEPPPELKERVLAVVRSEADLLNAAGANADRVPEPRRPRRRPRLGGLLARPAVAALAAAALLATGGAAGALIARGGDDGAASRTYQARFDPTVAPRATGSLVVADGSATLRLARMPQAPPGRVWEVWVTRGGRTPEPTAALFTVDRRGQATVAVPSDLRGAGSVLITDERRGGAEVPTRQPALEVPLTT
jgi:anti-sigma factor RsiW